MTPHVRPKKPANLHPQDGDGSRISVLRKSLRRLAAELSERGHRVSHTVVGELLKRCNFSLQANRKTREGDDLRTATRSSNTSTAA
jgi:hypothetical protein